MKSASWTVNHLKQFLNRAIAHLHRNRDRAHGERIGGVCAGSARGRDESFGKVGQRGLVEERGH